MKTKSYIEERLDKLIAEGEIVLRTYDQAGNIDRHDLWFTEAKNFLSVNAPDFLDKLHSIAPKYRDQLLLEARGRAAYNLIQEQLEVLKLARGQLSESRSPVQVHEEDKSSGSLVDAVEMKPGIFGFSLDLKMLFKRLWQLFRRSN
jgi:hypothetical protein